MLQLIGSNGKGQHTQTAGTRIQLLLQGRGHAFTHLIQFRYTMAGTQHTLTAMRGSSRSTAAAAAASAQTTLVTSTVLKDGGGNNLAANDVIAYKLSNGEWELNTVASVAGDNVTITLTNNISSPGVAAGSRVVLYGFATDSYHADYQWKPPTGATTDVPDLAIPSSLARSKEQDEPLVLDSDNGTAAGKIESVQYGWSRMG